MKPQITIGTKGIPEKENWLCRPFLDKFESKHLLEIADVVTTLDLWHWFKHYPSVWLYDRNKTIMKIKKNSKLRLTSRIWKYYLRTVCAIAAKGFTEWDNIVYSYYTECEC